MFAKPMTKDQRVRRAALLCCHLTRNLAYFKAGWGILEPKRGEDFWLTVLGNHIDVCVLEWSKLFGEDDGKHHWKHIVDDEASFKARLMSTIGITQAQWQESWREIKVYRDKFIAHLDSDDTMNVPHMDIPFRMVNFFYKELKTCSTDPMAFADLPPTMSQYYHLCYSEGVNVYKHNKQLQSLP
jgi:hypothetical protein